MSCEYYKQQKSILLVTQLSVLLCSQLKAVWHCPPREKKERVAKLLLWSSELDLYRKAETLSPEPQALWLWMKHPDPLKILKQYLITLHYHFPAFSQTILSSRTSSTELRAKIEWVTSEVKLLALHQLQTVSKPEPRVSSSAQTAAVTQGQIEQKAW